MSIRETLITADQAADIRKRVNAMEGASHGPIVEEIRLLRQGVTNEERGKLEQYEVWRDKPERLFAYIQFFDVMGNLRVGKPSPYDKGTVTVWTGQPLGHGTCFKVWRDNFGGQRASIRVTIAGETYSGTAFVSSGDYCRLRKVKA